MSGQSLSGHRMTGHAMAGRLPPCRTGAECGLRPAAPPRASAAARRWPVWPAWLGIGALLLSACGAGAPYSAPSFPFGPGYDGGVGAPVLLTNTAWWQRFDDPVLDRMIALALAQSPTLAETAARAEAAEATLRAVPGAGLLTSSVQAGLGGATPGGIQMQGSGTLGLSWVLDPYGSRRAELRIAASARDIASAEDEAARLLLLLNLSSSYLSLRHAQTVLAQARAEEGRRRATLSLTRRLADAGAATELETTRAQARLAEVQADLPGLAAAVPARLGELAVLAGLAPGALPPDLAAALQAGSGQPQARLAADIGVPADLLRSRPDIRIAERGYYAALARIEVRQAERYPRLSLTGSLTSDLISGGSDFFLGPVLSLPSLPNGEAVLAAEAEARAAHAAWRARVLQALLEVETALDDYQAAMTALSAAAEAARLQRRALDLTRRLFEDGEATLSELITAEEAAAGAERRLADLRLAQGQSFVRLNVRLGAGAAGDGTALAP